MHLGIAAYEPLILYIGAIIAFLGSVFFKPQIGLYYIVPLLPMQTARYWLHGFPLGEKLVDIILLGVLLGLLLHSERPIFLSTALTRYLMAFFLILYLGLWQGAALSGLPWPLSIDDPRFSDWKNYVEMMLFFFVAAAAIRTRKQIGILLALICLSVFMVNRSYHSTVGDRDFSQFSDSLRDAGALGYAGENGMGAFQAEMAVFLIGLASFSRRWLLKLPLLGLAVTSIYCLAVTFSRGGYVGFLIGILVLGLIKERKLLVLLMLFLFSWQTFVPSAVTQRVEMTYQEGQGVDESTGDRLALWEDAMLAFAHDPAFGSGFDTYRYMGRVGGFSDTHNYYVKVLLETGLVGFCIFLLILVTAGRMSWQLRCSLDPFLSGLGTAFFAMLVCGMAVNFFGDRWTFLQVNGLVWVLLGLVARGLVIAKQQQELSVIEEERPGFASSTGPSVSPA